MIRLFVGLGNPGRQYQGTRHNAGFWFLDEMLARANLSWRQESRFQCLFASQKIAGESVYFIEPQGFMNRSGQAVGLVSRYFKIPIEQILVVHDELDFEPGVIRLKKAGGHGGHNGLRDIIANTGSRDFVRLRIGIGHPGNSKLVSNYVLSEPGKVEREAINNAIADVVNDVDLLCDGKFEQFMSRIH